MKILESQNALLTNVEVYEFLNQQAKRYQHEKRRGPGNLETLRKELLHYLESPPGPLSQKPLPFNSKSIPVLLKKLRGFNITKGEMVMLINMRPASIANLNAVLEDMENRYTSEEQQEICDIVIEVLGNFPPPPPDAEGEEDVMDTTENGG
ncbi:HRDC-like protein [Xylariomycetidae sp. FL2044]|nr:HRDC-like protein [Xylariomycetidae sp. FL2044]